MNIKLPFIVHSSITAILATSWLLFSPDPARAQQPPRLEVPPELPASTLILQAPSPKAILRLEEKPVELELTTAIELAQNRVTAENVTLLDDRKGQSKKIEADVMVYGKHKEGRDMFGRTLVVPAAAPDPNMLSETEEDLNVMAHLLEKAMHLNKEGGRFKAAGIDLFFSPSSASAVRHLYLAGHGALFLFPSPIPLKPDQAEDKEPKKDPAKSSAWDEARRELYRGPEGILIESRDSGRKSNAPKQTFDPQDVERLKASIVESLKEAANMRHVRPEETVTVILSRDDRRSGPLAFTQHVIRQSGANRFLLEDEAPEPINEATLLIRVAKSDIDAFAAGRITLEQFKEKAVLILY